MRKIKGFTLIELLIVITIVGILVAIAIPMYQMKLLENTAAGAVETSILCEEAKDLNMFKIRGKCVVWDATRGRISSVHSMLNSNIRADGRVKYLTIFVLVSRQVSVGHYEISKERAYQEQVEINAVYLPGNVPGRKYTLVVYNPPETRVVGQNFEKPDPSKAIANFINKLAKEDIKPLAKEGIEPPKIQSEILTEKLILSLKQH